MMAYFSFILDRDHYKMPDDLAFHTVRVFKNRWPLHENLDFWIIGSYIYFQEKTLGDIIEIYW